MSYVLDERSTVIGLSCFWLVCGSTRRCHTRGWGYRQREDPGLGPSCRSWYPQDLPGQEGCPWDHRHCHADCRCPSLAWNQLGLAHNLPPEIKVSCIQWEQGWTKGLQITFADDQDIWRETERWLQKFLSRINKTITFICTHKMSKWA